MTPNEYADMRDPALLGRLQEENGVYVIGALRKGE